jgi:hypothetical protein
MWQTFIINHILPLLFLHSRRVHFKKDEKAIKIFIVVDPLCNENISFIVRNIPLSLEKIVWHI